MDGRLPVRRLTIEVIVVVASILLAFALQAWWEGRSDREQQTRVLAALYQELRANSDVLDRQIAFHEEQVRFTQALLHAAAQTGEVVSSDSLDYLLAGVSSFSIPEYERAALDAALRGRELDVLENLELRRQISAWQRSLEVSVELESQDEYYALEVWQPLLREHSYMPQIWNVGLERIPGWQTSGTPIREAQDHTPLLDNREFVNVLLEKKMVHEDILPSQRTLLSTLDELVRLLDKELGRERGAT
jgi:hypothetical protein